MMGVMRRGEDEDGEAGAVLEEEGAAYEDDEGPPLPLTSSPPLLTLPSVDWVRIRLG